MLIIMCKSKSQPKRMKQNPRELTLLPLFLVLSGRFYIDSAASTEEITFSFCMCWLESPCSLLLPQPFHENNGQKTGVRWEWRSCPICWLRQGINLHQRLSAAVQNARSWAWDEMETCKCSFAACGILIPVWGFEGATLDLLLQNGIDCGCFPGMNSSVQLLKHSTAVWVWGTLPVYSKASLPPSEDQRSPYSEGGFHPTVWLVNQAWKRNNLISNKAINLSLGAKCSLHCVRTKKSLDLSRRQEGGMWC